MCWSVVLGEGARSWLSINEATDLPIVQLNNNYSLDELNNIWEMLQPECLICSATGSKDEISFVKIAAKHNVTSIQFIDTWYGYKKRFMSLGETIFPNHILVIDEKAKEEAISEGLPEDLLYEIGNPSWANNKIFPAKSKKDIVFVSQPINRHYKRTLGYNELDAWNEVIKLRDNYPDAVNKLIIAQHPAGSLLNTVDIDGVIIEENCRKAIRSSGSVIGVFSSLLVDACIAEKNVISLQPGLPQKDMCSLSRHGYIPKAGNVDDLYTYIIYKRQNKSLLQLKSYLSNSLERLEQFIKERCMQCIK